jgi:hypothetical protein
MSVGDQGDIVNRLQRLMPNGWFPNGASAIRDALITGIANMFAFIYSLLAYVRLQTRIATATDGWLDMIAADYFGTGLPRGAAEPNERYRGRIIANVLLERATRRGLIRMLTSLTGRVPIVFEPARPADTGGYSVGAGYGTFGGYGNLGLPYQSFVTAFRPSIQVASLANVLPWGLVPNAGGFVGSGGYGAGSIEYASQTALTGVSDSDIYSAIDAIKVAGTVVWTRLLN